MNREEAERLYLPNGKLYAFEHTGKSACAMKTDPA